MKLRYQNPRWQIEVVPIKTISLCEFITAPTGLWLHNLPYLATETFTVHFLVLGYLMK